MSDVIKKVVLQLGRKEVELTLEEAKKLYEGLSELFETKTVERFHYPWWTWSYPVVPTVTPYHITVRSSAATPNPDRYNYTSSSGVSFSLKENQSLLCNVAGE